MTVTISPRTLVAFATGLAVALIAVFVFQAWRVDAAPGDSDSTFVPITPCRLIDTRPGSDRVGTIGTFSTDDTNTIAAHGANGECTIPSDAVGLSLNMTAVGATAPTFITVWPDGDRPLASSLNPTPGQPPTPNAVTTTLSGAGSFEVYNLAGNVNLVIDVNGYHTKTSLQQLAEDVADLKASAAAADAKIVALETAQPFAVTARDDSASIESFDNKVLSVQVTAPVKGQVTVNSTATSTTTNFVSGIGMDCSITTGTHIDAEHVQRWQSTGAGGDTAQLAGTRTFDLESGATATYNLVCESDSSPFVSTLTDSVLTAIFTPAP